jgi:hypothetical protein
MTEDATPGVKSKASTMFIERLTEHPDRWDLAKPKKGRSLGDDTGCYLPGLCTTILHS